MQSMRLKEFSTKLKSPTIDVDVINQKAEEVKRTKDALDGNHRLEEAKQLAIAH